MHCKQQVSIMSAMNGSILGDSDTIGLGTS